MVRDALAAADPKRRMAPHSKFQRAVAGTIPFGVRRRPALWVAGPQCAGDGAKVVRDALPAADPKRRMAPHSKFQGAANQPSAVES
ncbi:hypothetical protein BH23VER1_BH23VER1_14950 [soil metagenome]